MKMSSTNPMAIVENPGFSSVNFDVEDTRKQRFKAFGKVFMLLAIVGVSIGVGYAIGNSSSDSDGDSGSNDPVANARAVMLSAVEDNSNEMFSQNFVNWTILNGIVDEYESDPSAFENTNFVTTEIASALKTIRDDSKDETQRRRFRRGLLDQANNYPSWVLDAFRFIDQKFYPDPIVEENDRATVFRSGGTCYIIAEESGDEADWADNLDLGDEDILSLSSTFGRDESCGCSRRWFFGGCREYNQCSYSPSLGRGYQGFVKSFNAMRFRLRDDVNSNCRSGDFITFAGYSRGAGVILPFVYVAIEENLVDVNRIRVATFGSPRVLKSTQSDILHNALISSSSSRIYRLVNNQDLVPSIPYPWMGDYKHAGTCVCLGCSYCDRDRPFWAFNPSGIGAHTSYDDVLL